MYVYMYMYICICIYIVIYEMGWAPFLKSATSLAVS